MVDLRGLSSDELVFVALRSIEVMLVPLLVPNGRGTSLKMMNVYFFIFTGFITNLLKLTVFIVSLAVSVNY